MLYSDIHNWKLGDRREDYILQPLQVNIRMSMQTLNCHTEVVLYHHKSAEYLTIHSQTGLVFNSAVFQLTFDSNNVTCIPPILMFVSPVIITPHLPFVCTVHSFSHKFLEQHKFYTQGVTYTCTYQQTIDHVVN